MHGLLCVFSSSIFSEMGVGLSLNLFELNRLATKPVGPVRLCSVFQPWVTDTYHCACCRSKLRPFLTQQACNPLSRLQYPWLKALLWSLRSSF